MPPEFLRPAANDCIEKVLEKLRFCGLQMGMEFHSQTDVTEDRRKGLSDIHVPFFEVPKFTRLHSHVVADHDIAALLKEEHIACGDWAMAQPNLAAVLQDFAKFSHSDPSCVGVPPDVLDWAVNETLRFFQPVVAGKDLSPQRLDHAMGRMNMATSPGWPWNAKYKTKREWTKAKIDHSAIVKHYLRTRTCFWNVSHKEEIRPLQKLKENKSRSFMSGPAEENVACIMYFGKLLEATVDGWRLNPMIYGMNPRARGWQLLLEQFGDFKAIGIDFSKFDGSLMAWLFWLVYRVCVALIPNVSPGPGWPPAHEAILSIISSQLFGPCVFPHGVLCYKYTGNPSGSGLTIFVNSVIHLLLVLIYLKSKHNVTSEDIQKSFHFNIVGDDGRHGADDAHIHMLDFEDMNRFYAHLGATIEIKPDNEVPLPPHELVFLSQSTVTYQDTWVPTPESPEKLIASAELRNDETVPENWHVKAYHLARLIQITNQLVFSEYWDAMNRIVEEYIVIQTSKNPGIVADLSWQHALAHRATKDHIAASFTKTYVLA